MLVAQRIHLVVEVASLAAASVGRCATEEVARGVTVKVGIVVRTDGTAILLGFLRLVVSGRVGLTWTA